MYQDWIIQGPGSLSNFMLNSMLVKKDFQTWRIFGWQNSRQPIERHVRKSLLKNMEFNMVLFSNPRPRSLLMFLVHHFVTLIYMDIISLLFTLHRWYRLCGRTPEYLLHTRYAPTELTYSYLIAFHFWNKNIYSMYYLNEQRLLMLLFFRSVHGARYCDRIRISCSNNHNRNCMLV